MITICAARSICICICIIIIITVLSHCINAICVRVVVRRWYLEEIFITYVRRYESFRACELMK